MSDPGSAQLESRPRAVILLLGLSVLLIIFLLLSLSFGSVSIPLDEILNILSGRGASKKSWEIIVLSFRLPKALTAILAGAALAVSGLQMQTLFRNPLAGPFVLGISSGASLGVAISILLASKLPLGWISDSTILPQALHLVSACLGSALVFVLVLLLSRKVASNTTLLILGLMFGYISGGLINLMVYFSDLRAIQSFLFWSFGSFSRTGWELMVLFAPIILIAILSAFLLSKPQNALQLGEGYARSLGVPVERTRIFIVGSASLLAGVVTAFCGPIAFIGITVPHLCRTLLQTFDHRLLIPAGALLGAAFCLGADLVSQVPGSQETLPLNSVTSLLGAPLVIWIILRGSPSK
jgi:iron complex transport system permease protein